MPLCAACGEVNPQRARFCLACGARLAETPARDARRIVTVVFCDLSESTALGERVDAERLRTTLRRYHEALRRVLERHGGLVEKFIGDAVMAVFGLPRSHEDDALRAVRAAVEMREAVAELRLVVRIGVNTGEVVVGEGETLVTGDAVNVAARLEHAAEPGQILLGAETLRLVKDAVEVDPRSIDAHGKSEPVQAAVLLRFDADAAAAGRPFQGRLVGRRGEFALLDQSLARAVRERACALFTVLGVAGVGKSRLTAEWTALADARLARGRCLHYGEGITFWPLLEILHELGEPALELRQALRDGVASSSQQLFRRVRLLLEDVARKRPLVLVMEDLHWAEPTFLDLLDHLSDLVRDAPLMLLCTARPEFLDGRSGWGGGKLNATTILLEPLPDADVTELIDSLAGGPVLHEHARRRVMEAAEGNPLFVEELVSLLREERDSTVPPTIQAVLQARLDLLHDGARELIGLAAVEGTVFHRSALCQLADTEPAALDVDLDGLVRRDLIRPAGGMLPGDEAFRFRHILVRDAAYGLLSKERRSDLHARLAAWLDGHGGVIDAVDEFVGHHLEQAARCQLELGDPDPALATRAGERLFAAGVRALARVDPPAACNLLGRSRDLLPADHRLQPQMLLELAIALELSGRISDAAARYREAARLARHVGDVHVAARADVAGVYVSLWEHPGAFTYADAQAIGERSIAQLEGDDLGLAEAWSATGDFRYWQGRNAAAGEAFERAIEHANRAGRPRLVAAAAGGLSGPLVEGPTPVEEALELVERLTVLSDDPLTAARLLCARGLFVALGGDLDRGYELMHLSEEAASRLGAHLIAMRFTSEFVYIAAMAAGRPADAEGIVRRAVALLEEQGAQGLLSTRLGYLAHIAEAAGRLDEADACMRRCAETGAKDDFATQVEWRLAAAKLAARRRDVDEAERLAMEAVELCRKTDSLVQGPRALEDLAAVYDRLARSDGASKARREALAMHRTKGAVIAVSRLEEALTAAVAEQ